MPGTRPRDFVLWPDLSADEMAVISPRALGAAALSALGFCAAMSLPFVEPLVGLSPAEVWAIGGIHFAWDAVVALILSPLRARHRWPVHVAAAGNLLVNTALCIALPVATGSPDTPLWAAPVMYATFNGALREVPPSFVMLGLHVLAPLAAIPLFPEAADARALVGPAVASALSFAGYQYMASLSAGWRQLRRERDEAIRASRHAEQELERRQLAQDLHDSVGSALSLVGMYGDLVDLYADTPTELRRVAGTLKEAASEGLVELRGLLEAMAPTSGTGESLGRTLSSLGRRASLLSGVAVEVAVAEGPQVRSELPGPVRLATVRIFQEALNNALRHGAPERVDVRLSMAGGRVVLEVEDDGQGFDATERAPASPGRGLRGMVARASSLGGTLDVISSPGRGTRVRVDLPLDVPPPVSPSLA